MEYAVERKTRFASRCRPFRGLALALFALFGGLATAAQAMLLTLDLRWEVASEAALKSTYNLQVGSIVQVIGYKGGDDDVDSDVSAQFGDEHGNAYGRVPNDDDTRAAPYGDGDPATHVPTDKDVWLADNTQTGHEILYTGTIQNLGSWYGLYTQITVDSFLYDHVYIRVFGATSIEQGEVTASYWGVSDAHKLEPSYATDRFATNNVEADKANYFEVIPEPATAGLLGLGGIALAAWRRRRLARSEAGDSARMEE